MAEEIAATEVIVQAITDTDLTNSIDELMVGTEATVDQHKKHIQVALGNDSGTKKMPVEELIEHDDIITECSKLLDASNVTGQSDEQINDELDKDVEETSVLVEHIDEKEHNDSITEVYVQDDEIIEGADGIITTAPVKVDEAETVLSDDENMKVLHVMEPISREVVQEDIHQTSDNPDENQVDVQTDEVEIQEYYEPIIVPDTEYELARNQLERLETKKRGRPAKVTQLTKLTPKEIEKEIISKLTISGDGKGMRKRIPKIPQKSPDSTAGTSVGRPVKNPLPKPKNDTEEVSARKELLAILQDDESNAVKQKNSEQELALAQINSLPKVRRGRKVGTRLIKGLVQPKIINEMMAKGPVRASDLVSSLVDDWSDSESKDDELILSPSITISKRVKATNNGSNVDVKVKRKPVDPVVTDEQQTLSKRSRIIKKKIIWDPDLPETGISYASLVSSGPSTPVVVHNTPTKRKVEPKVLDIKQERSATPPKRKKLSEIDRLLRDEGAANMLNSLNECSLENGSSIKKETTATPLNINVISSVTITPQTPSPRSKLSPVLTALKSRTPKSPVHKQTPAKRETTKRRTAGKSQAMDSWGFIYANRGEDSMIIRRRSNSSYSSTTSHGRQSVDNNTSLNDGSAEKKTTNSNVDGGEPKTVKISVKKPNRTPRSTTKSPFEFAKPTAKKIPAGKSEPLTLIHDMIKPALVSPAKSSVDLKPTIDKTSPPTLGRRSVRSNLVPESPVADDVKQKKTPRKQTIKVVEPEPVEDHSFSEIDLIEHKRSVQIVLKPLSTGKLQNVFTINLLKELVLALEFCEQNDEYNAILITSTESSFSNGIDFTTLIQPTADKQKKAATELAECVRNLFQAMSACPKPLIAGVRGKTIGIGVTMLPLFDFVIATDRATFETNYMRIGQIPEGCAIWESSHKISGSLKNNLLMMGYTISAPDALRFGLLTKIASPEKFSDEIVSELEKLASFSEQSLLSIKKSLNLRHSQQLDGALTAEKQTLINHWTSTECIDKFKLYLSKRKW